MWFSFCMNKNLLDLSVPFPLGTSADPAGRSEGLTVGIVFVVSTPELERDGKGKEESE